MIFGILIFGLVYLNGTGIATPGAPAVFVSRSPLIPLLN